MPSKYMEYYQTPQIYRMSASQKNSFHLLSLLSNFLSKNNRGPLQFWETGYSKCNNEFIQSKHKILYQV